MKQIIPFLLILLSCKQEYSEESRIAAVKCPTVLDSSGFEELPVGVYEKLGRWNIPVHAATTTGNPITGKISLYGWFLKDHDWLWETPSYSALDSVRIQFKYRVNEQEVKMGTTQMLTIGVNGKPTVMKGLVFGVVKDVDVVIPCNGQVKVQMKFINTSETGVNVWIDDFKVESFKWCK